jgi:hypothetical protein
VSTYQGHGGLETDSLFSQVRQTSFRLFWIILFLVFKCENTFSAFSVELKYFVLCSVGLHWIESDRIGFFV